MVLVSASEMLVPLPLRYVIDEVIGHRRLHMLTTAGGVLVAIYAVNALATYRRTYVMHVLGQRFVLDIRTWLYDHLQKLSLTYYDTRQTGEIMSRVSNDVNVLEDLVTHGTDTLVVQSLTLLGVAVLMSFSAWQLALAVLVPVPVLVVAISVYSKGVRPRYRHTRDRLGEINARLQDNLSGIRVIKAFSREDFEASRFRDESVGYYDAMVRAIRIWSSFFPKVSFLSHLGKVVVIGYGGWLCYTGHFQVGTVVAFLFWVDLFYRPIGELFRVNDTFQRGVAAADRLFEILDTDPDVQDAPDAIELPPMRGEIALEHVTFRYATGEDVLNDVSLHARPGERLALVGASGAGKTTIINLIPRFYDPLSGRVTVDGYDVRQVTQRSLRQQIAMVLQETFLFSGTCRENIRYGRLDATDQEIEDAARAANAHDFITALPQGYETQIGERGVKLSGGQRQRMAIARAVLADPKILILDEATSSVDTESEILIHEALERLMRGRTTVIIAHRLSTVKNADTIVALDDGRIVEQGDHATLLACSGRYREMYDLQFRLDAEDAQEAARFAPPVPRDLTEDPHAAPSTGGERPPE